MIPVARRAAEAAHRLTTRRGLLLSVGQLAVAGVIGTRMWQMQLGEGESYRMLAEENRINFRLLAPDRGRILDRTGKIIAGSEPVYRIAVVREAARDVGLVLRDLQRLVALDDETVARVLEQVSRVQGFVPVTVLDRVAWEDFARIAINAPALPGVIPQMAYSRVYPFGEDFTHQVGYVGPVSESDIDTPDAPDPLLTIPDYQIGKTGIEKALEPELRGRPGTRQVEVNASGREMRSLGEDSPVAGADLRLTLDHHLQNFMRVRLAGNSAAAIVLDVASGDLLGVASAPSYDPNLFVRGISKGDYAGLRDNEFKPLADKSVQGAYPPGSTIKMSIALAGLTTGVATPQDTTVCRGYVDISGRRFHCWKRSGHGRVDMKAALRESCDVYFYGLAQKVGIDAIFAMNDRLGLGRKFDLPLSAVSHGLNPSRQWKLERHGAEWLIGDTINASIGQGYVLASPIQLAVMTARIATGRAIVPQLVRTIGSNAVAAPEAESLGLDEAALALVRQGMFEVSNHQRGTAYSSRVEDPAFAMGGKTGTSQVFSISTEERAAGIRTQEELPWNRRDHALFVCFAPYDAPRIAAAVVVEHGGGGSTVAAPIARDMALFALHGGLPPLTAYPASQRARIATDFERLSQQILPPDDAPVASDRA